VLRNCYVAAMLLSFAVTLAASSRKQVPEAPLPAVVSNAKKVFLTNGGGNSLAFDEFYSQMKQWGRFDLVGGPSDADLIIDLRYIVEDRGPHVWSATNTDTGQTSVYSRERVDPQLVLSIYEPATKNLIWSATDHRRLARREKNRDKETINSADRLVQGLRERMSPLAAITREQ
jgi:hypothetical protein